jgi:hypothetical protein
MLALLYLAAGFCLALTGGAVLLYQVFIWFTAGERPAALLGILWELVGVGCARK